MKLPRIFSTPYIPNWLQMTIAVVSLSLVLFQAYQPTYRPHLQVDVVTFQQRAVYFLDNHTWTNLGHNEYQPGALWFFVASGLLASDPSNFEAYLTAIALTNIALLGGLLLYARRHGHPYAVLLFALIIGASGPILLYRFEVLVASLTLLAWHLFRHHRPLIASGLLGLSTAIKVYPIILLPLFIFHHARRHNWIKSIQIILAYILGLCLPILALTATGATLTDISTAFAFHGQKPVIVEGSIGQLVMLGQQLADIPLRITPGNGVHGITSDLPLLTNDVLNYAWIPPLLILYGFAWYRRQQDVTDPLLWFLALLLFVIFSKVLNPQYLFWPLIFLPFIKPSRFPPIAWTVVLLSTVATLLLTTVVYPVNFSAFLAWLNQTDQDATLFTYTIARNLFLLVIAAISTQTLLKPSKPTT